MRTLLTAFLMLLIPAAAAAADPAMPGLPDLRTMAAARDGIVSQRLDALVPGLMRRAGVKMWILVAREYNEDPVVKTMLPATWMSARRRTILVFFDKGPDEGVERLAVARYRIGDFQQSWNPDEQPDQWARLAEIVAERAPETIAVNISDTFALADGLTVSQQRQLIAALGPEFASRLVSQDALAIGWLETRVPAEMTLYASIMRAAHALIPQGLSEKVITPGVTTTEDVVWWYRERLADLRLDPWCQPSVSIQRRALAPAGLAAALPVAPPPQRIEPGDLLHVDFCAGTPALKTDTQQMAYVLRAGESAAPAGLVAGMQAANRVQDALTSSFRTGITGNQLLQTALDKAKAAGLNPIIYTHPIGLHGHAAGAAIGMWDNQGIVPGNGEWPINPDTAWSIELAAEQTVPEWDNQSVRFKLEVDGFFNGTDFRWIDGRQTELLLVPRQP